MNIYEIGMSVTEECLKDYKSNTIPNSRKRREEMKRKQIENALSGFATGCAEEEIELFCDFTLLGNGKRGILFTKEGLYSSEFGYSGKKDPIQQPVLYSELEAVSLSEDSDSKFCFHYRDGRTEKVYGSIYTGFLITALNRILKAQDDEAEVSGAVGENEAEPKEILEIETEEIIESVEAETKEEPVEIDEYEIEEKTAETGEEKEESAEINETEEKKEPVEIHEAEEKGESAEFHEAEEKEESAEAKESDEKVASAISYEQAVEQFNKGLNQLDDHNDFVNVHYFYRMAKQGNPVAMEMLATYYAAGRQLPYNPEKAAYWMDKCMELIPEDQAPEQLLQYAKWIKIESAKSDFIRNNPYIPDVGTVIKLSDKDLLVLSSKLNDSDEERIWVEQMVRELETGDSGILTIGWNPQEETYVSSYFSGYLSEEKEYEFPEQKIIASKYTDYVNIGATQFQSHVVLRYTGINEIYPAEDCQLRICSCKGNGSFRDLENDTRYEIPVYEMEEPEVHEIYIGDYAEICIWKGQAYFAATMNLRLILDMYEMVYKEIKWEPELADVAIVQEEFEYDLWDASFFDTTVNDFYPADTCSPLGHIVLQIHA